MMYALSDEYFKRTMPVCMHAYQMEQLESHSSGFLIQIHSQLKPSKAYEGHQSKSTPQPVRRTVPD